MKKLLIIISLVLTSVFLTSCGAPDNAEGLLNDAESLLNDAGSFFNDIGDFINDAGSYISGLIGNVMGIQKREATEVNQTAQIGVDDVPQSFYVTYSLSCSDYNSVGNEWSCSASVNGKQCYSGSTVTLTPREDFQWCLEVVERDSKSNDSGYISETMTLSDEICASGYTKSGDIAVQENDGRYSGNVAYWTYTFKLIPIS